jgi:hypothetical protein
MMKRILCLVAVAIISLAPLGAQSITVISPNGGENWTIGSIHPITWVTSGHGSTTVRIALFQGTTNVGVIATGVPAGAGAYAWTAGSAGNGTAAAGSNYRIRVRGEGGTIDDYSDAPFTLSAAPPPQTVLSVTSPNGGESWMQGSDHAISWTASNNTLGLRLVLLKDGQVVGTIRDNLGSSGGSVPWKAGDYQGGTAAAGSGYKVRVETANGQYSAASNGPFTITLALIAKIRPIPVQPLLKKPDLVACLAWDGKRPYLQEHKTVSVRIKNVGPGPSSITSFSLYVEGHGTHTYSVPALSEGGMNVQTFSYSWGTLGHKTVRVIVDPNNQISETEENNNQIEKTINVISPGQDRYVAEIDVCSDGSGQIR